MNKSSYVIAGSLIMLVDENPIEGKHLTDLLKDNGAEVINVRTPEEAYDKIKNCDPDIIISDYHFSQGIDGCELLNDLSFIKKNYPMCILMTDNQALKITDIDDVAVCILRKPFKIEDLFNVISDARMSLDYLKQVVNMDAYRFKEMEVSVKIGSTSLVGEFVEAKDDSVIVCVPHKVASSGDCQILIKNFLNNAKSEYLIEGQVYNVQEQDGFYWIEIKIKESFMFNWKKLCLQLDKKQDEIMDFLKKANG